MKEQRKFFRKLRRAMFAPNKTFLHVEEDFGHSLFDGVRLLFDFCKGAHRVTVSRE